MKKMSDEDLMRAYYECNDEAVSELHRRYCVRLEQFFHRGGLSEQDAEDKVQDTFVRVMNTKSTKSRKTKSKGKGRYDPQKGASFKTWLFTIAARLLIDQLRKQGREVNFSDIEEEGEGEESEPFFEETIPDAEPTPEEEMLAHKEERLAQQMRQDVHECMEKLPDRERIAIALWLETHGNMKLKDLAEILGVSVPTAHRVLDRAFCLMRKCLKSKGYGETTPTENKRSKIRKSKGDTLKRRETR